MLEPDICRLEQCYYPQTGQSVAAVQCNSQQASGDQRKGSNQLIPGLSSDIARVGANPVPASINS